MLGLKATDAVKTALRELRDTQTRTCLLCCPSASALCVRFLSRGTRAARFRLDDGRTAHLVTFFDMSSQSGLVLVWFVEEIDGERVLTLRALEHVDWSSRSCMLRRWWARNAVSGTAPTCSCPIFRPVFPEHGGR